MSEPVLEVEGLVKHFAVHGSLFRKPDLVHAVDGVSFSLDRGEILTVVGESGCGKSTLARCLLRLVEPTGGEIRLHGENVLDFDHATLRRKRRAMQIVFQDPYASLDPRQTVYRILATPLRLHGIGSKGDRLERVTRLLQQVGIGPEFMDRHPHELSGGQRQRIAIASALVSGPSLLILDEPVSALDVSIRSQIMNLLKDLQKQYGMSYLLVAHDLGTTRYMADWLAVMYLGKIVEYAEKESLFREPRNPYTRALFSAALPDHPDLTREEIILSGEVPSPIDPPAGCSFHPRCPFKAGPICAEVTPELKPAPHAKNHWVACHLY